MNVKTLKALKKSISYWDGIYLRKWESDGRRGCALCSLFNNDRTAEKDICIGCPVYAKTGKIGCEGTPFIQEINYLVRNEQDKVSLAERDFLISLLPEGETWS